MTEMDFYNYCIDIYSKEKNISKSFVTKLFIDNKVYTYISSFFNVLNDAKADLIINDIDIYLTAKNEDKIRSFLNKDNSI